MKGFPAKQGSHGNEADSAAKVQGCFESLYQRQLSFGRDKRILTACRAPVQEVEQLSRQLVEFRIQPIASRLNSVPTAPTCQCLWNVIGCSGKTELCRMEDSPDFLSREEKEFVVTVQEKFHEEFAARKAQGKAYPCLLGSVALARILRAAEGNVEKACEWFQALLRTLSDPATDELVQDALSRFGNDSHIINASMLPHHEAISDFYHAELCAPLLSPDGDMVMYLPLVDLDRDGILEHLDWDHWVKFSRACTVMQCAALDFLSRKNQRFARMILIVDLEGMSMEGVVHRTFARAHRRDVIDSFQQRVAAEIVTSVYVVNVPWAIANLFSLCKTFIPAKFLKKVRVLSSNALKDSSFVENCGGQEQLSELFASRKGLVSSNSQRLWLQIDRFLEFQGGAWARIESSAQEAREPAPGLPGRVAG